MPHTRSKIGERILRERLVRGWSQADLASAASVSRNWVSNIECGRVQFPDDKTVVACAAVFGVTPQWLRYGAQPKSLPSRADGASS